MPLTTGVDHVALATNDIDALIAFYRGVFDAEVRFDIGEGNLRHAAIEVGGGTYLHPFQVQEGQEITSDAPFLRRGRLDHVALTVEDDATFEEVRKRLVDAGASDGTVTHWGICREVTYRDSDGCAGEVSLWVGEAPRTWAERGIEPWPASTSA